MTSWDDVGSNNPAEDLRNMRDLLRGSAQQYQNPTFVNEVSWFGPSQRMIIGPDHFLHLDGTIESYQVERPAQQIWRIPNILNSVARVQIGSTEVSIPVIHGPDIQYMNSHEAPYAEPSYAVVEVDLSSRRFSTEENAILFEQTRLIGWLLSAEVSWRAESRIRRSARLRLPLVRVDQEYEDGVGIWVLVVELPTVQSHPLPESNFFLDRPKACVGCANYYGQSHGGSRLICAMHPYGVEGDCPDYS